MVATPHKNQQNYDKDAADGYLKISNYVLKGQEKVEVQCNFSSF